MVAGDRAGVGRGRGRPDGRRPRLEHRDADAAVRAAGERLAEARRVAVVLEVERDRAHALVLGEEREQVAGVEHGLVAARDDRVEAQPAARRERVDGEVAALADERDRPGRLRAQRVAPQRRALVQAHHPVAVGADHRQRVAERGRHEAVLERAVAAVGEARAEHDRAAAAARARLGDHVGHAGGRDRDDDRVGGRREVGERREHLAAEDLAVRRVHAPDLAVVAERGEVAQRLVRVGLGARGRADDGDRPRAHEAGEVHRISG